MTFDLRRFQMQSILIYTRDYNSIYWWIAKTKRDYDRLAISARGVGMIVVIKRELRTHVGWHVANRARIQNWYRCIATRHVTAT